MAHQYFDHVQSSELSPDGVGLNSINIALGQQKLWPGPVLERNCFNVYKPERFDKNRKSNVLPASIITIPWALCDLFSWHKY